MRVKNFDETLPPSDPGQSVGREAVIADYDKPFRGRTIAVESMFVEETGMDTHKRAVKASEYS